MAKLILLQLNPQIHSGEEKVLAIFFDMNALWEDWLLAIYRHSYRNDSTIKIPGKKRKTFWDTGHYTKVIESDILIEKIAVDGQKETVVLDAKWKRPVGSKPADADLKQMFVYNMMWDSKEAWLVYPQINGTTEICGNYAEHTKAGMMGMTFVDIFEKNMNLIKDLELPHLKMEQVET